MEKNFVSSKMYYYLVKYYTNIILTCNYYEFLLKKKILIYVKVFKEIENNITFGNRILNVKCENNAKFT